jgi:glucose-1-phosphate cytidylyltransferase
MLTYGDGVSNIDINALMAFHKSHGRVATVSAVRPPARFGDLRIESSQVTRFEEKPQLGEGWINGGFFVFEAGIFDFLTDDLTVLEKSPLEKLAQEGQLMAYQHHGYWQSMDTLRDKHALEELWVSGNPPWKD